VDISKPVSDSSQPERFQADSLASVSHEHNNCAICKSHDALEESANIVSLVKKLHEKSGHECSDPKCEIEAPHAHVQQPNQEHVHGPNCNHSHEDQEPSKVNKFPVWPLEDFIAHSELPTWLREATLNASFLSPALIVSGLLESSSIPKTLKTWLSITAMHLLNRGHKKIPRLGLTYAVAGAAQMGAKSPLGSGFSRFLATSLIAIIEKFSDNGHNHEKLSVLEMIQREASTLSKNLTKKSKWQELWPSLINIETKVQLIAPVVTRIIESLSKNLEGSPKVLSSLLAKVLGISLSFVGVDRVLGSIGKALGGENSAFASSLSSVCACCGSPVCSAAATDMAISNSL
jgi:hypothetical protein